LKNKAISYSGTLGRGFGIRVSSDVYLTDNKMRTHFSVRLRDT